MNYIWAGMILASFISASVTGKIPETVNAVFDGAATAVSTLIGLAGIMCFWTGIMKIAERCGVSDVISKLIAPAVNRLFPNTSEKARKYISMNMTANMLGMGNAATPMGMIAAEELDRENGTPSVPSDALCMLVVINTSSFQLIPSTIIALRAAAGSQSPTSVILPIWITSACALIVGITFAKLQSRLRRRHLWNT